MTDPTQPPRNTLFGAIRGAFLTGLVIVAPAALTIWVIATVIDIVDSRVMPLIPTRAMPGWLAETTVPGLGLLLFLGFTLGVGWLAKGLIGRSLIRWSEQIVGRMPVVRSIYNALKQIAETVFTQSGANFRRAALVAYPRPGMWAVVFVSTDARGEIATRLLPHGARHVAVFLPTTPNPTSGFLLFVPEDEIIPLDMTIEDAAKLIISAGLVAPERLADGRTVARPLS